MTYPYPADLTVINQALVDKIVAGIGAGAYTLPFTAADVYYGDQERLPRTPSICVESGDRPRNLAGVPNMTENVFTHFILVYHNPVAELQQTRKDVDHLAYQIEHWLHQDLQLKDSGGNPRLIYGFVINHESGFTFKRETLYRTARLTFQGKNKTSLPVA